GKDFRKLEGLFARHSGDVASGICAVHALVYQNDPEGENSLKKLLQLKLGSHAADTRAWAEGIYLAKTAAREAELEEAGLYEELSLLLIEKGKVISGEKARLDELLKLSRIYRENLKQNSESFLCLYKAIEISGFNGEMNDEAEKLAAETRKLEELANLFYEKALSGSYPANLEFALRSARIFSSELGKHEEASVILKWILANVEFREGILYDLLKILQRLDKVYEYCETAERYLERIKEAGVFRETLSNLVYFFDEKLGQPDKALLYLGRLLNIEPDNILHYRKYFDVVFKSGGAPKLYDEFFFITGTALPGEVKRECLLAIAKADSGDPSKRDRLFGVYEKLLLIEPENREALVFAVSYLAEAKRFGEVAPLFMKLSEISGEGEKIEWLYKAAGIYEEELNDAEGALSVYRRILELLPGDAKAAERIERLLEKTRLYSELVRFLDSRAGGSAPSVLLRQASILREKMGLFDRACGIYWKVLFADPMNGEAYGSLQDIYLENEDYRNLAILYKHVEKFIDDFRERSAALFKLGRLYLEKLGDREQAVAFFEHALAVNPEHRECADVLANLYFGMRNFAKITPVIEPFISKLSPEKDREALKSYRNMLATAAFETGDHEKAAEEFRELSGLAPERYDYSLLLAKSLIKMGKEEDGYSILGDILKKQKGLIDPDNLQYILTTLGLRSLDSGNFADAAQFLEEAYNLKGAPQRDLLAKLAFASEKGGDFKKACVYYSLLLDLSEDQSERYKYLMKCAEIKLEKTGETASALELLKEAANIKQ
ncbi:MAG: tetratricopeptide repeat protein, partial [Deltaproteobacteria bacterium]|nr:tetratricopeptide repeat protein [Deltaproteobacteria bacterium]